MRVYGTSPLYNYVELVFRSKRLFIGSIIIASLATVLVYFSRASNYTARALILLTETAISNPEDKQERGTIQFKINVLTLDLRNPDFYKEALVGLNPPTGQPGHMDGIQYEQFTKDVKDKLTYASENNVLEIACTWRDERAADIVKAIYSRYAETVLNEETKASTTNTALMQSLLSLYTDKRNKVEKTVARYEENHVLTNLVSEPGVASNQYQQALHDVARLTDEKELATMRFNYMKDQFAKTPKTLPESVVFQGPGQNPNYAAAQTELRTAKNDLEALKAKYSEIHPLVKKKQEDVERLTKEVQKYTSPGADANDPIMRKTLSANPAWIQMDAQIKADEISMISLNKQLAQAQANLAEAKKHALSSPVALYDYRRMTDNLGLYSTIQSNLASQVEQAQITEERDKQLKAGEIKMVVKPEAEKENKGAKGMLMLAAGPLIGLIIAFSFSLFAESMDHSLRTPLDIEKHLGKPVLAVLPRINSGRGAARRQLGGEAARPTLPSS